MKIDINQLTRLAESFRQPDREYAALDEAWQAYHARTPAQRRADDERMLSKAARVEIAGGRYAEAAGWLRRWLAAQLIADAIADGTPFH